MVDRSSACIYLMMSVMEIFVFYNQRWAAII